MADRYRIERELGAGGMATVYLAHDLKHDRQVALKVLRPELAAVLGADRFVVEIKTTASLQHPHILPLFDSGTADGFLYYVMPYIQGETLRNKLDRETQLGIEEAVKLTCAIADALDYAHRHGVIHRDIKPENILLHDGRPMVADFGIALAVSAAAGGRMTETGLSLGTPHYMSPEQATAEKEITGRSDIYSLASVLYEMLAGQPPHLGGSAQQIIMKIIAEDAAPVTTLRKSVPAHVAAAVAKALEKLPADRFATAAEFAAALQNAAFATAAAGRAVVHGTVPPSRHSAIPLLAAATILATGIAVWGWLRPTPDPEPSRQRVLLWRHAAEPFLRPGIARHATQAAIAPDGSSIVFSDSVGGGIQILRKHRHEAEATPLAGTEGGVSPFFSPDGAWIGFVTEDGRLRKIPVSGGGAVTLNEDVNPIYTSAAWLDDGTIVFVPATTGLARVPAEGGASQPIGAEGFWTQFNVATIAPLPGSRGFLYTRCPGNCALASGIHVFDFAADSGRLLVANAVGAWYAPTGHLLYTERTGGLYAVGFDPKRLQLTSGPLPVLPGVAPAAFTLSASGGALYEIGGGGGAPAELVWLSRDGAAVPVDPDWQADFGYPALSPDGRALAVSVSEGTTQLWIRREDGTRQKLTQDGTVSWRPAWTSDGQSLVFASNQRGTEGQGDFDVYRMRVDGSAPAELLLDHVFGLWEAEVTRDGQWLTVRSDEAEVSNVYRRHLGGDTALVPVVVGRDATQMTISPDGRWLAYSSPVTGRPEVYVTPFPDGTGARLVSRDGGTEPRWAHSGRELFYKSGNRLMVVDVFPGSSFAAGNPRVLFSVAGYRAARNRAQYDVAPDDRRFVMIRDVAIDMPAQIIYVENWLAELQEKVTR
jgi:Tol biopolymer transport system component